MPEASHTGTVTGVSSCIYKIRPEHTVVTRQQALLLLDHGNDRRITLDLLTAENTDTSHLDGIYSTDVNQTR